MTMAMERTFIAIKPDGVNRALIGDIISRFEKRGYKLVAMKLLKPSKELAETHYAALSSKPFFAGLVEFICSGPVCAMVWEGTDVVKTGRTMIGATKPTESAPGTIRGDYGIDVGRNVIHGSDAVDTAEREIGIWFKPEELVEWEPTMSTWIYE
ncbi:Nucleoside diphosphate kinase [Porphyridium purpureum]|uniref:Nucleoside diphosphate kinase n=1 Tax=Porphyridium purpureum TaxID=35688 RepID=A0A5J4YUP0_PORPP|nr:Nucleoside diphosphate kinase [Porphyridium purpureum]|eukprot:POR7137..scf229_5